LIVSKDNSPEFNQIFDLQSGSNILGSNKDCCSININDNSIEDQHANILIEDFEEYSIQDVSKIQGILKIKENSINIKLKKDKLYELKYKQAF